MLRRICTILAILAGIGVIVVSQTKLREHIQGIITQREDNAKERDKQKSRAERAEKTLMVTSNDLTSTKAHLATTTQELETTKANLANVTSARDKLQDDLAKAKDAEKATRQLLSAWETLGLKPDQIKGLQDDLAKSKDAAKNLETELQIVNKKKDEVEKTLRGFLYPGEEVPLPPGLKGTVVVVDPKWEFVVLDVGQNKGVIIGGIMMIHRDSKLVGKVKIASVLPDRCIANIMPGFRLSDVKEGDQALY